MAIYVSPSKEFPQNTGDIERLNPGWEIGDSLPDGWHEVVETATPAPIKETTISDGQTYLTHLTQHRCEAELVDDVWTQVWHEDEKIAVGYWDEDTEEWVVAPKLIEEP